MVGGRVLFDATARVNVPAQQRVALLDPLLRGKLRDGLAQIQAQFQIPVIMITHDPEDIQVFAETLVIYDGGQVRRIWPFFKRREDITREYLMTQLQTGIISA